jgi:hypothetical protein
MGGLDLWNIISGKSQGAASTASNIASPTLPLQPQARTDMAAFMADPSSVLKDPAFLAAENLGAENISRQAGAAGMANSGNRLADLFKFGETSGLAYENQRYNQLLGLLQPSPAAGNMYLSGQQGKQGSIADLIKQMLGSAGSPGAIAQIIRMMSGGGGDSLPWGGPDQGSFDLSGVGVGDGTGIDFGPPDLSGIGDVLPGF